MQWFVGSLNMGSMLHECVPLSGSAGPSQGLQPLLPHLPGSLYKTVALFHPLLRGILGLWALGPKADLVRLLSPSPSPSPLVWVSPSWKWHATWSCPMVERVGSSCARATCPLNSLPVSGGGLRMGEDMVLQACVREQSAVRRLLGSEPSHP